MSETNSGISVITSIFGTLYRGFEYVLAVNERNLIVLNIESIRTEQTEQDHNASLAVDGYLIPGRHETAVLHKIKLNDPTSQRNLSRFHAAGLGPGNFIGSTGNENREMEINAFNDCRFQIATKDGYRTAD